MDLALTLSHKSEMKGKDGKFVVIEATPTQECDYRNQRKSQKT